jgi:hypothetical protein
MSYECFICAELKNPTEFETITNKKKTKKYDKQHNTKCSKCQGYVCSTHRTFCICNNKLSLFNRASTIYTAKKEVISSYKYICTWCSEESSFRCPKNCEQTFCEEKCFDAHFIECNICACFEIKKKIPICTSCPLHNRFASCILCTRNRNIILAGNPQWIPIMSFNPPIKQFYNSLVPNINGMDYSVCAPCYNKHKGNLSIILEESIQKRLFDLYRHQYLYRDNEKKIPRAILGGADYCFTCRSFTNYTFSHSGQKSICIGCYKIKMEAYLQLQVYLISDCAKCVIDHSFNSQMNELDLEYFQIYSGNLKKPRPLTFFTHNRHLIRLYRVQVHCDNNHQENLH